MTILYGSESAAVAWLVPETHVNVLLVEGFLGIWRAPGHIMLEGKREGRLA